MATHGQDGEGALHLTGVAFDEMVNGGGTVLVDFRAPRCGPAARSWPSSTSTALRG
jgi:hypothetical protein